MSALLADLSRVAHEAWVCAMREEGYVAGNRCDLVAKTHPLLVSYGELSAESLEWKMRAVATMLAELGERFVDRMPSRVDEVGDETMRTICEAVHGLWVRRKIADGYRQGEPLDEVARVHPDLVPFTDLRSERQRVEGRVVRAVLVSALVREELEAVLPGLPRRGTIRPVPAFLKIQRPASVGIETRLSDIRLDMNELLPHLGEEAWQEFLRRLRPEHLSAYPEPYPVYEALSSWLGVEPGRICLGWGSDAVIGQVLRVFLRDSDTLLLPVPTYGMYAVYAKMAGARVVEFSHDLDFRLDVPKFREVLTGVRPAVVAIAQPNGALGSVLADDDLEDLIVAAERQGTLVILDEAHVGFHEDIWLARLDDHENLVLVRTFSKSGGLAGLRFGFSISSTWIRELIMRARPVSEISSVTAMAVGVLLERPEWIEASTRRVLEGKAWLADRLENAGVTVFRGHANFLQIRTNARTSAVVGALKAEGIRVRDQSESPMLRSWVRITCGPPSMMAVVWSVLKRALH